MHKASMEAQGFIVPKGRGKRGDLCTQGYVTQFRLVKAPDTPVSVDGSVEEEEEVVGE